MTDDLARLLQDIPAAQELAELAALERAATHFIENLTAHLTDIIAERRDYLNSP